MSKYIVHEFADVFTPELAEYIMLTSEEGDKKNLVHIMNQVENFERKNLVEFVSFYGSGYIIFREVKNS
jgi:hypothetical protein